MTNKIINEINAFLNEHGDNYFYVSLENDKFIQSVINSINKYNNDNELIDSLCVVTSKSYEHENIIEQIIDQELLDGKFYTSDSYLLENNHKILGIIEKMPKVSYFDEQKFGSNSITQHINEQNLELESSLEKIKNKIPNNILDWINNNIKDMPIEDFNLLILFLHKKKSN